MKRLFCLLIALVFMVIALTACVGAGPTSGSQNIQPPTTTAPSTPTQPKTQIWLERQMEIWYHSDAAHLFCTYSVSSDAFNPGQDVTVTVTVTVENAGAAFPYTGALEDQFGVGQLRADHSEYTITSQERPATDDATAHELAHLETAQYIYKFVVPQDAPEDSYTLELIAFGERIRFDTKATLRPKYVPCLADLPEEAQKIIARDDYGFESDYYSYARAAKSKPVYGEFGDTYVVFYRTGGDAVMTYETVNGLQFVYGSSATIQVFVPTGIYTLTEAFESGLLTAEQVKRVHENWLLVGSVIGDRTYDPQIRVKSSMKLTHWGEMRWAYDYLPRSVSYFAGEMIHIKVEIVNYGPETTCDSITDLIGATAWLISDQTGYTVESTGVNVSGREPDGIWSTGSRIDVSFAFTIPEDFDEGQYTFVFTVGDEEVRFDEKAAEEERNMTILRFMGSYESSLFFGKDYMEDPEYIKNKHMPVYGQFVGNQNGAWYSASVFIYPTDATDGQPSIQIIDGLEFEIPDGYQLYVISEEYGGLTLAEAFETGIITKQMLREVYDNYIFLQNSSTTIKP